MRLIDSKSVKDSLNKCYLDYDPDWSRGITDEYKVLAFKHYIERNAGLVLDFKPRINASSYKRFGYELTQIAVIDEPKFTMWLLKWS